MFTDSIIAVIERANGSYYVNDEDLTDDERAAIAAYVPQFVGLQGECLWAIGDLGIDPL